MEKSKENFSQAESKVRQEIIEIIQAVLGKKTDIEIEYPRASKLGDYTVPCFLLAKKAKTSPAEVAKNLATNIKPKGLIAKVQAIGPYVNFFVNKAEFSKLTLTEITKEKEKYGSSKLGKGKKIMLEYFSPNTNKPLTIGHIRNIALGQSISRILKFTSHKVVQTTLYNDRGIAIIKAILGYQKWSEAKKPKDANLKPDHFVGNFYVQFSQKAQQDENLEQEAKRALQSWEEDEPKIRKIWQQLMIWVYEGYAETLQKLGIDKFDESYYESEFYTQGKEIVEAGLTKGIFKKHKDGYVYAPLEQFGLPDKILLRSNGTTLYITQDMYLATLKNKHEIDESVYVVGSEQEMQIKQLFKILELLDFERLKTFHHLSYGMVRLPDGKIKSREGLTEGTSADEIIDELETLAETEIKSRFPDLSAKEIKKRAEIIAISAIKFYILLVNPKTTMVFDPKKSIAFTGKTGPYLQYTHARINSLLVKAKVKPSVKVDFSKLASDKEFDLVKLLARFPVIIENSVAKYDPSILAIYLHDVAQQFSLFYESSPILPAEEKTKKARLLLASDVQIVMATGLELLGITPIAKM